MAFQSSETTKLSGTMILLVHSSPVLEFPGPTHFPSPTGRMTQISYLMLAPHLTQHQATLEAFQAFIVHTSALMIPGTMHKSPSTIGTLNALTLLVIIKQYLKVPKLTMKHARLLNSPMLTIKQLWPSTRERPIDFNLKSMTRELSASLLIAPLKDATMTLPTLAGISISEMPITCVKISSPGTKPVLRLRPT